MSHAQTAVDEAVLIEKVFLVNFHSTLFYSNNFQAFQFKLLQQVMELKVTGLERIWFCVE